MTNREWLEKEAAAIREETGGAWGRIKTSGKTIWVAFGQNATHSFEVGVDAKDRLWILSSSEYYGPDRERRRSMRNWQVSVRPATRELGYVGHW